MYMFVSNLLILSRGGIMEITVIAWCNCRAVAEWKRSMNMRSVHVCGRIAMHSMEMNCQE